MVQLLCFIACMHRKKMHILKPACNLSKISQLGGGILNMNAIIQRIIKKLGFGMEFILKKVSS